MHVYEGVDPARGSHVHARQTNVNVAESCQLQISCQRIEIERGKERKKRLAHAKLHWPPFV